PTATGAKAAPIRETPTTVKPRISTLRDFRAGASAGARPASPDWSLSLAPLSAWARLPFVSSTGSPIPDNGIVLRRGAVGEWCLREIGWRESRPRGGCWYHRG